jgi:hypothetical protein
MRTVVLVLKDAYGRSIEQFLNETYLVQRGIRSAELLQRRPWILEKDGDAFLYIWFYAELSSEVILSYGEAAWKAETGQIGYLKQVA